MTWWLRLKNDSPNHQDTKTPSFISNSALCLGALVVKKPASHAYVSDLHLVGDAAEGDDRPILKFSMT
jgi:hypothetical protein